MAYNNYPQAPFWDFVRSMAQNGAGVDHTREASTGFGPHMFPADTQHPPPPPPPPAPGAVPGAFPFSGWGGPGHHDPFLGGWGGRGGFGGPGPHGRGARRGRHGRRERSRDENERSRSRSRTASAGGDHPEGEPRDGAADGPRRGGRHGRGRHGRSGPGGEWGHGQHGRRGPQPFGGPGGFDLSGLFDALNSHPISQQPWAQMLRQYAQQAGLAGDGQRSGETLVPDETEHTFTPPIDVFSTEIAYVLHIAIPGAKKEDVGVNWDSDKGELNIAGVVYRQGDEAFLKTLSQSERKVGVFERSIRLPPGEEEKEDVDGDAISAKLEDGVLVVTVPKVEKEWTDVKRVDIN